MIRNRLAFFLNGLINNITYVIFLSAAEDILKHSEQGGSAGLVLLADILPSLLIKLTFPYFMHYFPYSFRILFCISSSVLALLMVAWIQGLGWKLFGIVLASLSSGLGEITFLALSSFYSPLVLSAWGAGTGMAGIAGAFIYLMLSTWLNLSLSLTMTLVCCFPLLMGFSYFILMTKAFKQIESQRYGDFQRLPEDNDVISTHLVTCSLPAPFQHLPADPLEWPLIEKMTLKQKLRYLMRPIFLPFMMPLFLVFWAEYAINQGIAPNLLFPLSETPFKELRQHYVYHQLLYQVGVFISRSSVNILPIKNFAWLSFGQVLLFLLLLLHSLFNFIPTIWVLFPLILIEGLLGGAVYINAFSQLSESFSCYLKHNDKKDSADDQIELTSEARDRVKIYREFLMGATAVADTFGITLAALTALLIQGWICQQQVSQGRDLCLKVKE